MKNIHIALVGGQTFPVYLGIMDSKPDRVILIHSEQTQEEAERIANEIQIKTELLLFDPVDLNIIFKKTEDCAIKIEDADNVSVNISGGTKPWSLAFFSVFGKRENVKIIYVDQNCNVWDFSTGIKHTFAFNMDAQFRLYGNPLVKYTPYINYTDEDYKVLLKIKKLRRHNKKELLTLLKEFELKEKTISSCTPKNSSLSWNQGTQTFYCTLKNNNDDDCSEQLSSPHIRQLLLNTGWFEYEVARLLSDWDKAKEIRMNCVFPSKEDLPKNEIDIIIDTGSKLLFIECKISVYNATDIDKFNSAVKNYGGIGSKAILITENEPSAKVKEKCDDYDIMYFALSQNMLGQEPSKMLYILLNQELFNINPK